MKKLWMATLPTLMVLLMPAVTAPVENHPGYFDFSAFESFAVEGETVDVALDESLIGLMADGMEQSQPEVAAALRKIKRLAVRVFEIDEKDNKEISNQVAAFEQKFEREGWKRVVRIIEDTENVHVYIQSSAGMINGLAVMVLDLGDEAVFVNLVGEIDSQTLGTLMKNADVFKDAGFEEFLKQVETESGK